MALALFTTELHVDKGGQIDHNLGTKEVVITVWQNDLNVTPTVKILDENSVYVYLPQKGTIVIVGDKQSKRANVRKSKD